MPRRGSRPGLAPGSGGPRAGRRARGRAASWPWTLARRGLASRPEVEAPPGFEPGIRVLQCDSGLLRGCTLAYPVLVSSPSSRDLRPLDLPTAPPLLRLFADSVRYRGTPAALLRLEPDERELVRLWLGEQPQCCWEPEVLWAGWPALLDQSGLLADR